LQLLPGGLEDQGESDGNLCFATLLKLAKTLGLRAHFESVVRPSRTFSSDTVHRFRER